MKAVFSANNYLPIINGLIGDKLAEEKDSWAIPMSFRLNGEDVKVEDLDRTIAGKNTLVFIHGLMADERIWKHFKSLEKKLSVLYIRYNTGLHISENAQLLSQLLETFHVQFKTKKLFLAGHSMGGLVIRSACYYGQKEGRTWVNQVRTVFLIAVPNAGAILEKVSHLTASLLNRIARWHLGTIGNIISQGSNGIKDLRMGSMLEEDWKQPDSKSRVSVPPLPKIDYHILVGSLSKDEKSLMSKYFGDGLVTQNSAVGVTLFKISNIKVFVRTGHNSILASPKVVAHVKKTLGY